MNKTNQMLEFLSEIAHEFNSEKLTWAVGASLLLYFRGIVQSFGDIDIMVAESDAEKAKEILQRHGTLLPKKAAATYKTRFFMEFECPKADVDIMAGFSIIKNEKEYYFPLLEEEITDFVDLNGETIPLHSVSAWRDYYELMDRSEKVGLIDDYKRSREIQ